MFTTLSYVLPVLFPSWRFFKTIEPSPRVEWAVVETRATDPFVWRVFRPPPDHLSLGQLLWRLVWNPQGNADLFVVSCAERIQDAPTAHSIAVIRRRVRQDAADVGCVDAGAVLQFRLVFVRRDGAGLVRDIVFQSDPFPARSPTA